MIRSWKPASTRSSASSSCCLRYRHRTTWDPQHQAQTERLGPCEAGGGEGGRGKVQFLPISLRSERSRAASAAPLANPPLVSPGCRAAGSGSHGTRPGPVQRHQFHTRHQRQRRGKGTDSAGGTTAPFLPLRRARCTFPLDLVTSMISCLVCAMLSCNSASSSRSPADNYATTTTTVTTMNKPRARALRVLVPER